MNQEKGEFRKVTNLALEAPLVAQAFAAENALLSIGCLMLQQRNALIAGQSTIPFHELNVYQIFKENNLKIDNEAIQQSYRFPLLSKESIWLNQRKQK